MRPIKLSLSAFGPYAETQVFDFNELGDNNLFLITGNTGSGKTITFDGISIALFGESSSGQSGRLAKDLRSDFAKGDVLTEATFDFSLGNGKTYRTYYCPEQERPKKSGNGMTKISATASIYIFHDTGELELLTEGVRTTKEKVESLLGLDANQFKQVVMLAQGQFRRLLEADSQDRERIFQSLFGTQFYSRIEQNLKEQAANIMALHREARSKLITVLEGAGYETFQDLEKGVSEQTVAIKNLKQAEQTAEKTFDGAQRAVDVGTANNLKIKTLDDSKIALEQLLDQEKTFKEKGKVLNQAEEATKIHPYYESRNKRQNEYVTTEKNLNQKKEDLQAAKEAFERAEKGLKEALLKKPEIEKKKQQCQTLEGQLPKLTNYRQANKALKLAKTEQKATNSNCDTSKTALNSLSGKISKNRNELELLRKADRNLDEITKAGQANTALMDKHDEISRVGREIQTNVKAVNAAHETVKDQTKTVEEVKKDRNKAFSNWLEGQSARIAGNLENGLPCPVCGSTDHPSPQQHVGIIVTDEQLKSLDEEISKAEKLLEEKKNFQNELQGGQDKRATQIETLVRTLGEDKDTPYESLTQKREALKDEYLSVKTNKEAIATKEKEITEQEKNLSDAQLNMETFQGELQRVIQKVTRLETVIEGLENEIEEKYREQGALEKEISSLNGEKIGLEEELENAEETKNNAGKIHQETLGQLDGAKAELNRCKKSFDEAQKEYAEKLLASDFSTEEAFLSSTLKEAQTQELKTAIETYFTSLATAKELQAKAEKDAAGLNLADLDELQQKLQEEKAVYDEKKETRISQETKLSALIKEQSRADEQQKAIDQLDKSYQTLGRIAEVAIGNNNKKTSFHRFILQTLLDEVLEVASYRLMKMTHQRFFLSRDDGLRDARRQSGLDLILTDTITGTNRPVKSLSGGEGFLAALALALGLSDIVQAHAGGVKLDTIFIDEGFGSLSPDALDQAIDILNGISGEGRLVGIISHVPELKQQIGAQLQIKESPTGSTATFRV